MIGKQYCCIGGIIMQKLSGSRIVVLFMVLLFLLFGFASLSPVVRLLYSEAKPYKFFGYEFKSAFDPIKIASMKDIALQSGQALTAKSFKVVLDLPYSGPEKVRQNIYGIIVNDNGDIKAYSTVCPHLNCSVKWEEEKPDNKKLWCNCHNGAFDPKSGNVTDGPPPKPLTKFIIETKEEDIYLLDIGGA